MFHENICTARHSPGSWLNVHPGFEAITASTFSQQVSRWSPVAVHLDPTNQDRSPQHLPCGTTLSEQPFLAVKSYLSTSLSMTAALTLQASWDGLRNLSLAHLPHLHVTEFNAFENQGSSFHPPDSNFSSFLLGPWKSSLYYPCPVEWAAYVTGPSTTSFLMQRTKWWISSNLILCEIKMSLKMSTQTSWKMQKALACNTALRCQTAEIRGLMLLPYHFYVT